MVANDRAGIGGSKRLLALYKAALDLPAGMRDRLWFTTFAALHKHQNDPLPLAASIWYRGRDAHAWLAEYRARAGNPGSDPAAPKQNRQFDRERVCSLPGHPLFPLPPGA